MLIGITFDNLICLYRQIIAEAVNATSSRLKFDIYRPQPDQNPESDHESTAALSETNQETDSELESVALLSETDQKRYSEHESVAVITD